MPSSMTDALTLQGVTRLPLAASYVEASLAKASFSYFQISLESEVLLSLESEGPGGIYSESNNQIE